MTTCLQRTPSVSVIVPVYNVERYLRQCLESLVRQTLTEIEIICVDDCGEDSSMVIAHEYAEKDDRILLLKHDRNRGLSAARNTGMDAARAPYIMFCDSDDWYEPEMCEKMRYAIESSDEVDIAICGVQPSYEANDGQKKGDEEFFRRRYVGIQQVTPTLVRSCDECAWDKIYRKSIIDTHELRFPEGLKNEDLYFFSYYIVHARRICFVREKLYHYRRRPGSIMAEMLSGQSASALDMVRVGCLLWNFFTSSKLIDKWGYHAGWVWKRCIEFIAYGPASVAIRKMAANILSDFMEKEGYADAENVPIPILEGLAHLCGVNRIKEKRWGGLIRRVMSFSEKKVSFLGLPLVRESYEFDSLTVKRFGTRKHVNIDLAALYSFDIDNEILLTELLKLEEFVYIPNQGNMGDALLASATLHFFDAHSLSYRMLCEVEKPIDTVVYGGGGIWTSTYEHDWEQFLPIFRSAGKVVILPSSFNDCPRLIEIMDERFVVFCREERSYHYLLSSGARAKIILDHDMALRMPPTCLSEQVVRPKRCRLVEDIMKSYAMLPCTDIGYLLRRDAESLDALNMLGTDLSGYVFFSSLVTKQELHYYGRLMLCAVAYFSSIVTDRLHVGIAAALLGKEVYLLDNTYQKLSSVYLHSLSHVPHIHKIDGALSERNGMYKEEKRDSFHSVLRRYHIQVKKYYAIKTIDKLKQMSGSTTCDS